MERTKPFLKISIVSTTETDLNHRQILEIVKKQVDISKILHTSLTSDKEENISLVISGKSKENFARFFKQDFGIMDKLMEKLSELEVDLKQLFTSTEKDDNSNNFDNSEVPPENYLVLRYSTVYSNIVRENFQYFQWFSDQFDEFIHFEEISEGFLRFYQRKIDFLSNNMVRNNFSNIQDWLKLKKVSLSPELMEIMRNLLPPE
ncbi:MAG: hypothetical protein ACTSVZ_12010 [Promethearchaeota archaeon]